MKMLLAGILGVCASLLVACGSNSKLISASNAGPLQSDFDNVASAVSAGDCNAANAAVQKAQSDLAALPKTTDSGLLSRLQQGVDALLQKVPRACAKTNALSNASTQSTPTTTPSTTTQPATTATTTTDTTQATTSPPTTSTTPPTTNTTTSSATPAPDGGGTPAPGVSPPGGGQGNSGGASGGGN